MPLDGVDSPFFCFFIDKDSTIKDVLNHITEGVSRPFKVTDPPFSPAFNTANA